jgi:formylglycine-generating enzyme required for sulfatase activity
MKAKKNLFMAFLSLFLMAATNASNISINTVPKIEIQTGDQWATITFDISWDNSWRTSKPANHDAAWIFVKCWDGEKWNHVYLDTIANATGIIVSSGSNYQAGNTGAKAGGGALAYYVSNKDSTVTNCPMEIELGYSQVQYNWGAVNPAEARKKGVVGVFLRRSVLGEGNINVRGVVLPWTFTRQGFTADDDLVVKVFAIEMVYVPTGNFYLGAGQGSTAANNPGAFSANSTNIGYPYQVTSAGPIIAANAAGSLWALANIAAGTIPNTFPNGYNSFYIMKYELTQGAYADFLNSITEAQANGNINNGPIANMVEYSGAMYPHGNATIKNTGNIYNRRNAVVLKIKFPNPVFGVDGDQNGIADVNGAATASSPTQPATIQNNDGQNVALIYARYSFLCSYADWAGLRPMTELEYEKACRGSQDAKADEFAWGASSISERPMTRNAITNNWARIAYNVSPGYNANSPDVTFLSIGLANERTDKNTYNHAISLHTALTQLSDNGAWWGAAGANNCHTVNSTRTWKSRKQYLVEPVRVGMLADGGTNRQSAGATYWGVMNMSDNAREPVINAGSAAGRVFLEMHGDGQLQPNGMSNVGSNAWAIYTNTSMTAYATSQVFYNRGIKYNDYNGPTAISTMSVTARTWWGWWGSWWANANVCVSIARPAPTMPAVIDYTDWEGVRTLSFGYVASRGDAGASPNVNSYTDMFQGIRCVRSARMSSQSNPTLNIRTVIQ